MEIHPVYQRRLAEVLRACVHEGVLSEAQNLVLVISSHQGASLYALVDPANHHRIKRSVFQGASTPVQRGLLEALCRCLEGRPIQDAGDHGAIELEFSLRDHSQPPPVAGVMQPESADPAFALPLALVRGLLADYRQKTQFKETANFFDPPVAEKWRALSPGERAEQITAVLSRQPGTRRMEFVRMEGSKRVVVRFVAEIPGKEKQACLLRFETALKDQVERELHVYLEPKKDENVLRKDKV